MSNPSEQNSKTENTASTAWMQDELVRNIPKEKLAFLSTMMEQGAASSQKELMSRMLPLIKQAKEKGLQFNASETAAAIAAIRKHSSATENARIDELLHKVESAKKRE